MCRSMVDIQSAAAEIRRGKKKERRTNHSMKIYMVSLLHRATINKVKVLPPVGAWYGQPWQRFAFCDSSLVVNKIHITWISVCVTCSVHCFDIRV